MGDLQLTKLSLNFTFPIISAMNEPGPFVVSFSHLTAT